MTKNVNLIYLWTALHLAFGPKCQSYLIRKPFKIQHGTKRNGSDHSFFFFLVYNFWGQCGSRLIGGIKMDVLRACEPFPWKSAWNYTSPFYIWRSFSRIYIWLRLNNGQSLLGRRVNALRTRDLNKGKGLSKVRTSLSFYCPHNTGIWWGNITTYLPWQVAEEKNMTKKPRIDFAQNAKINKAIFRRRGLIMPTLWNPPNPPVLFCGVKNTSA